MDIAILEDLYMIRGAKIEGTLVSGRERVCIPNGVVQRHGSGVRHIAPSEMGPEGREGRETV